MAPRCTPPRRRSNVDKTLAMGNKTLKQTYQKKSVRGKDAAVKEVANTAVAPKRKYQ